MTKEELIEEAERRYPIGTKFRPAHDIERAKKNDEYCIITEDSDFEIDEDGDVVSIVGYTAWPSDPKYGNCGICRVVYYKTRKKWAEIRKPSIDEEPTEENKDQALRYNNGKPQMHRIHLPSFEYLTKSMEEGATRYPENNWRKGQSVTQLVDCLLRHLSAFMEGEDLDKDGTFPVLHLGRIMSNIMMLGYIMRDEELRKKFDDRVKSDNPESYKTYL